MKARNRNVGTIGDYSGRVKEDEFDRFEYSPGGMGHFNATDALTLP